MILKALGPAAAAPPRPATELILSSVSHSISLSRVIWIQGLRGVLEKEGNRAPLTLSKSRTETDVSTPVKEQP
jgi:hypothetical protein